MIGYPQRYVILDTETVTTRVKAKVPTDKLTLRLGCALTVDYITFEDDDPHYIDFRESEEFKHFLLGYRRADIPIYVFAHNMGFDSRIAGVWTMLGEGTFSLMPPPGMKDEGRYKEPLFIADENIFIVRMFRSDGQRYVFLDTVQWFKESLEKIGTWIKHPKLMQPDADAPDEVWAKYCRGDVDVLHDALLRSWTMLSRHGINDWEYTPAAMSRRFYRMRFEKRRIKIPDDIEILSLDRIGYYGGYLDCFRVGKVEGPVYQIDVNSLYPHVMAQNRFPCEVLGHGDNELGSTPPDDWRPEDTTAEVLLETSDRPYPVRGSDQTYYCTGKVRTVLCGPELLAAWEAGHVRGIGRWVRYRTEDLFSDWARYWRQAREAAQSRGDKLSDSLVKTLMNSLHGKFGQQTGEWRYVGKTERRGVFSSGRIYSDEFRRFMHTRTLNGETWEKGESGEDKGTFVSIAAWTASHGRRYMDFMIETAGPENVLYIATDSLLVTAPGYHYLNQCGMIDGSGMGRFKVEGSYREAAIWNVNQIDLDTSKRRSGVKKGSREIEPGIWSTESWQTCATGVFSTGQDSVSIESILIRPSLSYSKRRVLDHGITAPWSIDCWSESPEKMAKTPIFPRLKDRE